MVQFRKHELKHGLGNMNNKYMLEFSDYRTTCFNNSRSALFWHKIPQIINSNKLDLFGKPEERNQREGAINFILLGLFVSERHAKLTQTFWSA